MSSSWQRQLCSPVERPSAYLSCSLTSEPKWVLQGCCPGNVPMTTWPVLPHNPPPHALLLSAILVWVCGAHELPGGLNYILFGSGLTFWNSGNPSVSQSGGTDCLVCILTFSQDLRREFSANAPSPTSRALRIHADSYFWSQSVAKYEETEERILYVCWTVDIRCKRHAVWDLDCFVIELTKLVTCPVVKTLCDLMLVKFLPGWAMTFPS